MAQVAITPGLIFNEQNQITGFVQAGVINATSQKLAHIGRLFIAGRAASKTLSTGSISFFAGAVTFANGGTTLQIGIQDLDVANGPIGRPDGTFDVSTILTGGAGLTGAAWNTATMNSGSKTMAHGDLFAVVFDMTARAGADTVTVQTISSFFVNGPVAQFPITNFFTAGAWQTTAVTGANRAPLILITFDDGTLGWIDFAPPVIANSSETFQDSTNPDERGFIFQVPYTCKMDAVWFYGILVTSATSDYTINIHSDPTGTPSLLSSTSVLSETNGIANSVGFQQITLPTEVTLARNTNYSLSIRATNGQVTINTITLHNQAHRVAYNGGTTLRKATRNNGAGVFSEENPAVTRYSMGFRISSIDDGASGGLMLPRPMNGGYSA